MRKASLRFLETLSNAFGPTGFERDPARAVKKYVEPYADEITADKLGSLIFKKKGSRTAPVILLPAHADEIGFMVSSINGQGYLSFNALGGWSDQNLLSQRVLVRTNKGLIEGVVASKPPHLMKPAERGKMVARDAMFIDIGCSNKKEAEEMGVRVGDPVVPDSKFSTITKTVFEKGKKKKGKATLAMGKAFDDRAGVFVAAEVVRRLAQEKISHPNTVVGAATTQEEVGLRGAMTTGYLVEPDVCITLDVDLAGDVPGITAQQAPSRLGGGVSICTYDASMIPNQGLKELVIETAEKEKIPYTLTAMSAGGTDGGAIHKTKAGCPGIYLGVPTRHIHSHVGLLDLEDLERCIDLVIAVIRRLDAKTVASFTAID